MQRVGVVLIDPLQPGAVEVGQQHKAEAGLDGGVALHQAEVRAQDVGTVDTVEVDDAVAVEHGEVNRLARLMAELLHIFHGDVHIAAQAALPPGEGDELRPKTVFAVLAVLIDHSGELETLDDAVDRALRHVDLLGDVLDADLLAVGAEAVENVKGLEQGGGIGAWIHGRITFLCCRSRGRRPAGGWHACSICIRSADMRCSGRCRPARRRRAAGWPGWDR